MTRQFGRQDVPLSTELDELERQVVVLEATIEGRVGEVGRMVATSEGATLDRVVDEFAATIQEAPSWRCGARSRRCTIVARRCSRRVFSMPPWRGSMRPLCARLGGGVPLRRHAGRSAEPPRTRARSAARAVLAEVVGKAEAAAVEAAALLGEGNN